MKKGKKDSSLGRALVKSKWGGKNEGKNASHISNLYTSDVDEKIRDEKAKKLQSLTQRNDLQEFLDLAVLSDKQFSAEKEATVIITTTGFQGPVEREIPKTTDNIWNQLRIPRRPKWSKEMSGEELEKLEKESFLEWRRHLASIEEQEKFLLSPFEKNLEVWKQLWRVVERCDLLVQIVDGRNPLLFRCPDLEDYVKEVGPNKKNLLLVNKADLLTPNQRIEWAKFFNSQKINFVFFSANVEQEKLNSNTPINFEESEFVSDSNGPAVLDRSSLLAYLYSFKEEDKEFSVGMIGYPNVGKSSTINVLVGEKRVGVAPTPGKTKHFQTIKLENGIMLCDCPGLVFPTLLSNKPEMICSGLISIDHLKEHAGPVTLVCRRIPRWVFDKVYNISIPKPSEHEDLNRPCTSEELLQTYGRARGFMTQHGQANQPKTARLVLKDYVNGKLCFVHPPPTIADAREFNLELFEKVAPFPQEEPVIPTTSEVSIESFAQQQADSKSKTSKPKKSHKKKNFDSEDSLNKVQAFTTGRSGVTGFTRVNFAHYDSKQ